MKREIDTFLEYTLKFYIEKKSKNIKAEVLGNKSTSVRKE